jgi:hypothetical protein
VDEGAAAAWLSALLVSRRPPSGAPPAAQVLARARAERVHLLVADAVAHAAEGAGLFPAAEIERLAGEIRAAAVEDVARTRELLRVVGALERAACQPIVFKGAALAHTHYGRPWLRPRLDVDVLVAERGRERASRVLRDLGYERPPFVSGRLVMYQEPLVRAEAGGLEHVVDLHWRVANPQAVSRVLSHAEIAARSVTVPVPGGDLRVPCPADALVLACVHRAAHHQDAQDLLWLFDIHLLASGLAEADWRTVVGTARAGAVTALCARGLALVVERFGTVVPSWVTAGLAPPEFTEASAVFLRAGLTPAGRLRSDLNALAVADRARLLVEIVVPPKSYMRAVHGDAGWLPWLYIRRVAAGAGKWLRPSRRAR